MKVLFLFLAFSISGSVWAQNSGVASLEQNIEIAHSEDFVHPKQHNENTGFSLVFQTYYQIQ